MTDPQTHDEGDDHASDQQANADSVAREVDAALTTAATSAAAAATSLWSTWGSALGATQEFVSKQADSVQGLTGWIDKLEVEAAQKDPLVQIKESLDKYLLEEEEEEEQEGSTPKKKTYEEWIRVWIDHDDEGQVEDGYYADDSPHRRVWNERNHQDGIDIHNRDNPLRDYVFSAKEKEQWEQQQVRVAEVAKEIKEEEEEVVVTFDPEEKPLLPDPVDSEENITMEKVKPEETDPTELEKPESADPVEEVEVKTAAEATAEATAGP